jgi:DNA-directed RNA polymerase subunit RPC12/RpoP
MQKSFRSSDDDAYDCLLNSGIAAVKGKDLAQARRWLEKAARLNPGDGRAWLWLSATTHDPAEQRQFLERAVAADPSNAAARRGLVMLSEKMDRERVLAEGQSPTRLAPDQPEDALTQDYRCVHCGGKLNFDIRAKEITCSHCGTRQSINLQTGALSPDQRFVEEVGTPESQVMDFVLPTSRAHVWAEALQRVSCQNCGALTILPAGQRTDECAYCGSNRIVQSAHQAELIAPQAVVLIKLDEGQVLAQVTKFLSQGWLSPDDLVRHTEAIHLRPAYYPFWTFSGTLEIPWHCEVNEGTERNPHWVARSGEEFEFFDDILVSGLRSLRTKELASVLPYELKELVDFTPDYLVGWPTLNYDLPLADASLLGREQVIKQVKRDLYHRIMPGESKRNLDTGAGKWSGLVFKHILLPLWVGGYTFQRKDYRLLVNGQTGKVGGDRPHDRLKLLLYIFSAVAVLAFLGFILYWLILRGG